MKYYKPTEIRNDKFKNIRHYSDSNSIIILQQVKHCKVRTLQSPPGKKIKKNLN